MKCPKCGRFSKLKMSEGDRKVSLYSDCSYCGLIKIEKNDIKKVTNRERDYVKISFAILTIVFMITSVLLYIKVDEGNKNLAFARSITEEMENSYFALEEDYLSLLNISLSLENYYDELQEMYSILRSEYSDLEDLYSGLAQEKADLLDEYHDLVDDMHSIQKELDDILSLSKTTILENNVSYLLPAGGNITLSYDIMYAGYIEVNYTSSTDVYFWVGSSISENGYYARYPAFPYTTYNGTFTVPVSVNVYLFIVNTNIDSSTNMTLTIEFTY